MATIEPRLIHLLNGPNTGHLSPETLPVLPPLQPYPHAKGGAHVVSLPPLGHELHQRTGEQLAPKLPFLSQVSQASQVHQAPPGSQQIPSLSTVTGEDPAARRPAPPLQLGSSYTYDGSVQLKKANHSLRALLEDDSPGSGPMVGAIGSSTEPSHSLRMILDDSPLEPVAEDLSTKKRHRALTVKDDFVQLPQPLKKQKSAQQVMPPIINGLHKPPPKPPNATIFPPIASIDFGSGDSMSMNAIKDFNHISTEDRLMPHGLGSAVVAEDKLAVPAKAKRRAAKPRRKWTEEETNHLLLGVSRHGVGKWTNILEDPDYQFNERTAGDLKDRFRTCCPDELRRQPGAGFGGMKAYSVDRTAPSPVESATPTPTAAVPDATPKPKRGLMLETILIGAEEAEPSPVSSSPNPETDPAAKPVPRKSRAHRKKLEDLEQLGICGPFKKSVRRERRPFTEQDDKEILDGIEKYGPAWTKIQRDENYNLSSRQPTDLRDRVRNKYPEVYSKIEKGTFQARDPAGNTRSNSVLEPTVNTTIENSLNPAKVGGPFEPHPHPLGLKESFPKWPLHLNVPEPSDTALSPAHDLNEHSNNTFMGNMGWMDISRLLLDDTQTQSQLPSIMPTSSDR